MSYLSSTTSFTTFENQSKIFKLVNIYMEMKKNTHGGARPGAGRKKGQTSKVSAQALLETIEKRSGGLDYTELLVEDFLRARVQDDKNLAHKYHTLISNKVLADRLDIEVNEDEDTVTAKRATFAAALAAIAGLNNDTK